MRDPSQASAERSKDAVMPRYRRWIWWIGWAIISLIRPLFCRLQVEGRENLPVTGGGVVACNHNYGPDFVFLGIASPRELCFMAKAEAFALNPILSAMLRAGGVFPVQRGKGDSVAIDTAVELASEGNLIAMFPEGTRSKSGALMRGKTGAARIALAAGVPIMPAIVTNSAAVLKHKRWRRPLVTVRFGKPIPWHTRAQASEDESEIARVYTDAVMGEIAKMLPQELRGEYGDGVKLELTEDQLTVVP
jgi:1-acyl-sn-glycerol-3-phosphate acyltransferase